MLFYIDFLKEGDIWISQEAHFFLKVPVPDDSETVLVALRQAVVPMYLRYMHPLSCRIVKTS